MAEQGFGAALQASDRHRHWRRQRLPTVLPMAWNHEGAGRIATRNRTPARSQVIIPAIVNGSASKAKTRGRASSMEAHHSPGAASGAGS